MALPPITYDDDCQGWQARNEFELESMCKQILNRYIGSVVQHRVVESICFEICNSLERYCEKHNVYFNRKDIEIESNIPEISDYSGTTFRHTYTPDVKVRIGPALINDLRGSVQWIRFREEFKERALDQAMNLVHFHGHKVSWEPKFNCVGAYQRRRLAQSATIGECEYCKVSFAISSSEWHEFILKINDTDNTVFNIHNIEMPPLKDKQPNIICEKFVSMI